MTVAPPPTPPKQLHRWMKLGSGRGRCSKACVECGLVAEFMHETRRKTPPCNDFPVYRFKRGGLDFGLLKKMPPCARLFSGEITIALEGFIFTIKRDLGKADLLLREKFRR